MADDDETPTPTNDPAQPAVEALTSAATQAAVRARQDNARAVNEAAIKAAEEARAQEKQRNVRIRQLAKQTKLGDEWATRLIDGGVSIEDAERAALRALADADASDEISGLTRIGAGDDERDKFIRGASAWLLQSTGQRSMLEAAKAKEPDLFKGVSFDPGEFRGFMPIELARQCLERAGVKTRGMTKMELVGAAFTHRSAYQTTSDFATLLENVLGKVLLGAYVTQENTWQRFCGVEELPDFRTSNRYRTGSLSSLAEIAEHGEYTQGTIPDAAKYPLITKRMGKIFGISREVIVNDDMGAITNIATELGRASMRTVENMVYALLAQNSGLGPTMADAQPFFHANRANVNATGSAISVAGLDADRVVMRAQKDPAGLDFLDLNPTILLVPDSLRGTADVINDSQYDPDTANKLQRKNMAYKMFKDIIGTPRLSAASTRRYLFADPSVAAAIVVAFLQGYGRGPAMEAKEGWRVDGAEWKVTMYVNAQVADAKAAVTNAGTP